MFTETSVIVCLGRRGSGKSYLSRRVQEAYPRKVIFDTMDEFSDADGTVCFDFNSFTQALIETEHEKSFTIIYKFDVEMENHGGEFNQALRCLWYRGNVLVVIEEIQNFASTHSMPLWVRQSLLLGRHQKLALLFTTQRPGECHKTILSQANHVFFGSLHEKNDVDYCRSVLKEKAFLLDALPERKFYYFQPGKPLKLIDNDLNEEATPSVEPTVIPDTPPLNNLKEI